MDRPSGYEPEDVGSIPARNTKNCQRRCLGSCRLMDRLPGFEPGDVGSIPTGNICERLIQIPFFFHIIVD